MKSWSRAGEWWEYKLLPPLAIMWLAALRYGGTAFDTLAAMGWFFLALVPGATFASIVNDLTDLDSDAQAGKVNRLAGVPILLPILLLALCLAGGLAVGMMWSGHRLIVAVYLAGWIAYTLYSVKPFRLKDRGFAGAACDAAGANVVPALLGSLLCATALGKGTDWPWLGCVLLWSSCFGLRGIMWHQMSDVQADRASGVRTWIVRTGPDRAKRIAQRLIMPLELASLAALLCLIGTVAMVASLLSLAAYGWLLHARIDRFEMSVTVVSSRPRTTLLMHEYYDVFLPLAALAVSALIDWRNLGLALVYGFVFPLRYRQVARDLWTLRDPQYKSRRKG